MRRLARSARINGVELSYNESGDGEPVLLVHGSNVDERIWDSHGELLAPRYKVIALTQRYFGAAPWPDEGRAFSLATHAADLAEFVRTLRYDALTLVGWSYGAAVCLVMARNGLPRIKRLFLYEPAIATFVDDGSRRQQAQDDRLRMIDAAKAAASAGRHEAAVELFMDGVNDEPGTFRRLPQAVRAMMVENSRMLPLLFAAPAPPPLTADDLRRVQVPVTIALGGASRTFYDIAARSAAACIPGARLLMVPGARHMWPIQDPKAFSELVLEFLAAS